MKQRAIPYMHFRCGSSKALFFLASDLPLNENAREKILLDAVGRDERQIDGLGGAHPLTSKIGIASLSSREDADVDYLFVQVVVGENRIDTTPNCGNVLSGIGPFAIESGLFQASSPTTTLTVNMLNSGKLCELELCTPDGEMEYHGKTQIDGVPGTSAPVVCNYKDISGSICGSLLPTGKRIDVVDDIKVTCVDNGMPVVVIRARDMGITGYESVAELNNDEVLKQKLESIRLHIGPKMQLGDVTNKAVPKMCLISPAQHGGLMNTRTFIPHKCHTAIGVLGAVSAATVCVISDTVASSIIPKPTNDINMMSIEHPSGEFLVSLDVDESGPIPNTTKAGLIRTARLLSRGELFVPNI